MEKKILMPKLKPDMEKAVLCAWLKKEGDEIKKGDVIFEVETQKVVSRVEATEDGTLKKIIVEDGDEAKVDECVGIIEK